MGGVEFSEMAHFLAKIPRDPKKQDKEGKQHHHPYLTRPRISVDSRRGVSAFVILIQEKKKKEKRVGSNRWVPVQAAITFLLSGVHAGLKSAIWFVVWEGEE